MSHFKTFALQASGFALVMAGVAVFAVPAKAGFEWTPPAAPPAKAAPSGMQTGTIQADGALVPEMPALRRDKIETIDMTTGAAPQKSASPATNSYVPRGPAPDMSYDAAPLPGAPMDLSAAAPMALQPQQQVQPPRVSALQTAPGDVSRAPAYPQNSNVAPMRTVTTLTPSTYTEALGFGSDIPLAFAMRQVVPGNYAYIFAPGVDQGARVSWNGGKPWNEVLADMVRPQGLNISISGNNIRVFPQSGDNGAMPVQASMQQAVEKPVAPRRTRPMLTASAGEVQAASQPTAETYIRRQDAGEPVAGPARQKPKQESSFWSRLGLKSDTTTEIRNQDKVVSQQGAMPVTPSPVPQAAPAYAPIPVAASATPLDAPAPAQPKASMDVINFWQAEKGDSLRTVLQSWSDRAGVQLYWVPPSDYVLPQPVRMQGRYMDAVMQALSAYGEGRSRPVGRLYPNLPAGPSVLVIEPTRS